MKSYWRQYAESLGGTTSLPGSWKRAAAEQLNALEGIGPYQRRIAASMGELAGEGSWERRIFDDGELITPWIKSAVVNPPVVARALNVAGSLWPLAQLNSATFLGESSILAMRNRSGQTLTNIILDYANYYTQVDGETTLNLDTIVVSAAVQTGAKGSGPVFPAQNEVQIPPNGLSSVEATGMSIAPGETFWIRTDVRGLNGGRYPIGYLGAGSITIANRERETYISPAVPQQKAHNNTPLVSSTSNPTHVPVGIRSRCDNKFSFGAVGDSWIQGSGDGNTSGDQSIGFAGRACSGLYPYIQHGFAGAEARNNATLEKLANKLAIAELSLSHILIEYGINDVVANGETLASIKANLLAIANLYNDRGVKPIAMTIGPRTGTTDGWDTVEGQTPTGGYEAGTNGIPGAESTITSELNDWLRTVPAPYYDVFDAADVVMSARNSTRWAVNAAWTNPSYTNDGTHPAYTGATTGGVAMLRDALMVKLAEWAAAEAGV